MTDAVRVATVGDNCLDEYLDAGDGAVSSSFVGGNAVNVAVGLARLGRLTSYVGAVGDDPAGCRVRAELTAAEVDVSLVRTVRAGATGVTRIRRTADGDRVFESEDFGTSADYCPGPAELAWLQSCAAVHLGLLGEPDPVRRQLARAGVLVSQDCSVAGGFDDLDLAFCSEAVAGEAEAAARRAVAGGAALCVVTRGGAGSLAHDGTRWWSCPAEPIAPIDTTGAGDSFIAGFIDDYLTTREVGSALRAGTRSAASTCRRLGAW